MARLQTEKQVILIFPPHVILNLFTQLRHMSGPWGFSIFNGWCIHNSNNTPAGDDRKCWGIFFLFLCLNPMEVVEC